MFRHDDPESRSFIRGRAAPVTCAACGCRLESGIGPQDGEWFHFRPLGERDARGCRVACVMLAHDGAGRPVLASIA